MYSIDVTVILLKFVSFYLKKKMVFNTVRKSSTRRLASAVPKQKHVLVQRKWTSRLTPKHISAPKSKYTCIFFFFIFLNVKNVTARIFVIQCVMCKLITGAWLSLENFVPWKVYNYTISPQTDICVTDWRRLNIIKQKITTWFQCWRLSVAL